MKYKGILPRVIGLAVCAVFIVRLVMLINSFQPIWLLVVGLLIATFIPFWLAVGIIGILKGNDMGK